MAGTPTPLTTLLVDDDPLVRKLIRAALEDAGVVVLAEAGDGLEGVARALELEPDVVLIDVVMPHMDGIAATREIVRARPEQAVVVLTAVADDEMGVLALRAGASGFLTKDLSVDALPRTLEGVREGQPAVSRQMTLRLIEHLRSRDAEVATRPVRSPLTTREWEVVDLLAKGLTNDEVARELVVSAETVRTHVKHILRKLGVNTRQDAVAAAAELRGRSRS